MELGMVSLGYKSGIFILVCWLVAAVTSNDSTTRWEVEIFTPRPAISYTHTTDVMMFTCTASATANGIPNTEIVQFTAEINNNNSHTMQCSTAQCTGSLNTSITGRVNWKFEVSKSKVGVNTLTCLVSTNEGGSQKQYKKRKMFEIYRLPNQISIEPNVDSLILQTGIPYSFICKVSGGYPRSRLKLSLKNANHQLLTELGGMESSTELKFKLDKSHIGTRLVCEDLTHILSKISPYSSSHLPSSNLVFIERNSNMSEDLTVYSKSQTETQVNCSQYISWKGKVLFGWLGIPAESMYRHNGEIFNLRFVLTIYMYTYYLTVSN